MNPKTLPAHAGAHATANALLTYPAWLSPGVRLFRNLRFPAKAGSITVLFVIPIATLMWFLWSASAAAVDAAASERQGIVYFRAAQDLLFAAQTERRAASNKSPDLAETQAKVAEALGKVTALEKDMGAAFATAKAFGDVQQAYQQLKTAPAQATSDATFSARTVLIDAILALIGGIADGSALSLDPDLDTYHLMNMSILLGPQYMEYMTRLRGLGSVTAATKELPPERLHELVKALTLVRYLDAATENSYRIGVLPYPEVVKALDMAAVDSTREAFLSLLEKQVLVSPPTADANAYIASANAAIEKMRALNAAAVERLDAQVQARIDRLQTSTWGEVAFAAIFVLLALYLMLAFYRVMLGGLTTVSDSMRNISEGQLRAPPAPAGKDETADLLRTMGSMVDNLRKIVGSTLESSVNVSQSSQEIAAASQDLANRTEASAAALEETSASMSQISETVQQTASTVSGAADIVRANAAAAERGGAVINQVVDTMQGINTSSSKIADIISVIDGIAFQTNILALNAAVEAARAGEQGRGFAVVASEVRSLAGRSAEAAKEIKTLIDASIAQVERGTQVVGEAGATISEIVSNAARIDTLMSEISVATREQLASLGEIGDGVRDLDKNTQQNAALVEQTAASGKMLSDESERLKREISFFRLA